MALQHLRSSTANKRPLPAGMSDAQLAINTNATSPGLFFKDSNGNLVKSGPVHVGTTAPNASPASGGATGNSTGELWLDTSVSPNQLKTWNGSAWVSDFPDEIPVAKLADGAARQLLQTDAAGTGVEWTSNVDVPGTLDVAGATTLDSTLTVPLGSAASPTLQFIGDTNTGIYSPGADQLALSTNGTGRLFVDASGNVGIATASTSLLGQLQIQSATGQTTQILLNNTGDTTGDESRLEFKLSSSGAVAATGRISGIRMGAGGLTDLAFSTFNASSLLERLRITSAGLVGIGTSSPGTQLHVNGGYDGSVTNRFTLSTTFDGNANSGSGIYFKNYYNNARITAFSNPASGQGGTLQLQTYNSDVILNTGIVLNSAGNVGIGTTSPGELLTVGGTNQSVLVRTTDLNGSAKIKFNADDGNYAGIGLESSALVMRCSNNSTPAERARIDSSGRLLVGTSSAQGVNKFQIQGSTADATEWGGLFLRRGLAAASIGTPGFYLGQIDFGNQDGGVGAFIRGESDAQWGTNDYPGRLVFSVSQDGSASPTERVRLDNAGNFFVYSSGSDTVVGGNAAGSGTSQSVFTGVHSRTSTTGGGTVCYRIYNNGTTFSVSDARQKKNIETARNGYLEDLQQLRVVKYNWLDQADTESKELGLIAQEVAEVFPGLVQSADPSDPESTLGIKSSVFSFMLIKALQEAAEKIQSLEARLSALESV